MLIILLFIQLQKIPILAVNILNKNCLSLQIWFNGNYIVLNTGKFCYMIFGSNPEKSDLILEDSTKIASS